MDYDASADVTVTHGKRKGMEDDDIKPVVKKAKIEPKEEIDEEMEEEEAPKTKKDKKKKKPAKEESSDDSD